MKKQKDIEWSGLLKIPDHAVIAELRAELSAKNIKIGQLESYIEELEYNKRPLRKLMNDYYETHLRIYEKALNNHDNNVNAIKKQKNRITERYRTLMQNSGLILSGKHILLNKPDTCLLMDLLLGGIAYAEQNNVYSNQMKRLYRKVKQQIL